VGFRVPGFGFRVSGSGFRVSGLGFRVEGLGLKVSPNSPLPLELSWGLTPGWYREFRIFEPDFGYEFRVRVQGSGFRVQSSGVRGQC